MKQRHTMQQGSLLDIPTPERKERMPSQPEIEKKMSRLDELIAKLCPDGVRYEKLEDNCSLLDSERKPVTKKNRTSGIYPYYGANGIQDYVDEYIFDGTFLLMGEDGSVINPDGSPVLNWATGKIWVNNHAHILSKKNGTSLRYLYYALQTVNISSIVRGTPPKLNQKNLNNIVVPIPPLPIQEEIVRILDKFTELTAELTKRKQQYQYYRNNLLQKETKNIKTVGEVCKFQNGFSFKSNLFKEKGEPILRITNIKNDRIVLDSIVFFDRSDYKEDLEQFVVREGDFVVAMSGATTGKIGVNNTGKDLFLNQRVGKFIPYENIIHKRFLYHFLIARSDEIYQMASGSGAQPNLSSEALKKMKIALPSLEEQQHIVSILDRFDALCNDLTSGLPAEIEACKKQYEYYRDKLLSFPEKPSVRS